MLIPKKVVETVQVSTLKFHAKVCDGASYTLADSKGNEVARMEDYVPSFFPGDHYGDYVILDIDIETGQIKNWKKPEPQEVAEEFGLLEKEE